MSRRRDPLRQGARNRQRLRDPAGSHRDPDRDPLTGSRPVRSPSGHRGRRRPRGRQDGRPIPRSPTRPDVAPGSWTTATPTAAWPRCAATGRGCSSRTCSRRAWRARAASTSRPAGERDGSRVDDDGAIRVDMGAPSSSSATTSWSGRPRPSRAAVDRPRSASSCPTPTPSPGWTTCDAAGSLRVAPVGDPGRGLPRGRERRVRARPGRGPPRRCGCSSGEWGRP